MELTVLSASALVGYTPWVRCATGSKFVSLSATARADISVEGSVDGVTPITLGMHRLNGGTESYNYNNQYTYIRLLLSNNQGAVSATISGAEYERQLRTSAISTIGPSASMVDYSKIRNWLKARANVLTGAGTAKVLCLGTSLTRGAGSNNASLLSDIVARSYPTQLAKLLTARGLPASWGNFLGDAKSQFQSSIAYTVSDPRVVMNSAGSGWVQLAVTTSTACAGGSTFVNSTSATGVLSFTPAQPFDTFVVHYGKNTSNGTFTVNVDGGSTLLTTNTAGTATIAATTPTSCSLGSHTLNIAISSLGTGVAIFSVSCYNMTTPEVQILNAGIPGATSDTNQDLGLINSANVYNRMLDYSLYAPDLSIIEIGTNDPSKSISATSCNANLQTLITALQQYGDVILLIQPPAKSTTLSLATQDAFRQAVKDRANANNVLCIDIPSRWGEYPATPSLYLTSSDPIHPNASGYVDIAHLVANVLMG